MKPSIKLFFLLLFFPLSFFAQNVTVQYSKKDYPYTPKDKVPTLNYKLRVSENGNVLSVTSIDKKILQYVYLDSLGNEIYSGQVEAVQFPTATRNVHDFVIKNDKLLCFTYVDEPKTNLRAICVIGIDMKQNKLMYEKLIGQDDPETKKTFSLNLVGTTLSEEIYLEERVQLSDTRAKIAFLLLDENCKTINTETVELENWASHLSIAPGKALYDYAFIYDSEGKSNTNSKIQFLKYDLKTKKITTSEIDLGYSINNLNWLPYFYHKNNNKTNYAMYDITTKTKTSWVTGNRTEYHTYALLSINIDDIRSSQISYYDPKSVEAYIKHTYPGKSGFDNYIPYASVLLKDNTISMLLADAFSIIDVEELGSFNFNSKFELEKEGHSIFKKKKNKPANVDVAASRKNGYYVITQGTLEKDEIKNKLQKGKDFFIIYHIDGTTVTKQAIADDPENNVQNTFLKGNLFTYDQTHRDHDLKYDWNKSKNIFCYQLKNEKAGTYKYVWLKFE